MSKTSNLLVLDSTNTAPHDFSIMVGHRRLLKDLLIREILFKAGLAGQCELCNDWRNNAIETCIASACPNC